MGVPPTGSGCSAEPEPICVVSAETASIPNATLDLSRGGYGAAVAVVYATGDARVANIHRRLRMRYNEAARLMERMEREGLVSAPNLVGVRRLLVQINGEMEICDACMGAGGDGRGMICGKCDGAGGYSAQAIEAQRAATTKIDAVADESAVRQDAPKGNSQATGAEA